MKVCLIDATPGMVFKFSLNPGVGFFKTQSNPYEYFEYINAELGDIFYLVQVTTVNFSVGKYGCGHIVWKFLIGKTLKVGYVSYPNRDRTADHLKELELIDNLLLP